METNCKVTIITPTYNAAKDIEACILSVANQTCSDKEHLIIDGLSTDATMDIVRKYAGKYPHIRFISEKDNGIYDAMNKGIDRATGERIYFLGSDDVLYNATVLADVFDDSSLDSFDIVYGDVLWGDTGNLYDGKFSLLKIIDHNICHQAMFYKRSLLINMGKFDTTYKTWADWLFNIKCFSSEDVRCHYIPIVIAKFALGGHSSQAVVDNDFLKDKGIIYRDNLPSEYVENAQKLSDYALEVDANNKKINDLTRQLAQCDQQVAELNRILEIKLGEIENLEHSLASTRQSLSWRLTKPLRYIGDVLKRD